RTRYIYRQGKYFASVGENQKVLGAARWVTSDKKKLLVAIVLDQGENKYKALATPWPPNDPFATNWPYQADIEPDVSGNLQMTGINFHFSSDGSKGVTVFYSGEFFNVTPVSYEAHSYSTLTEVFLQLAGDPPAFSVVLSNHGSKTLHSTHYDDVVLVGSNTVGTKEHTADGERYEAADYRDDAVVTADSTFDTLWHLHYTDAERYEREEHWNQTMNISGLAPETVAGSGNETYTGHSYSHPPDVNITGEFHGQYIDFAYLDLRSAQPAYLKVNRTWDYTLTGGTGPWDGTRSPRVTASHGQGLASLEDTPQFGSQNYTIVGAGVTLLFINYDTGEWPYSGYQIGATTDQLNRFVFSMFVPTWLDSDRYSLGFQDPPKFANFLEGGDF